MKNSKAFTLAEIFITLAIIGVVAAITLPSAINKINEVQYDRARERALLTIGEAGRIIVTQGQINDAADTEDFVKNYLSKQLKIIKYCGTSVTECGFSSTVTKLGGKSKIAIPTTINGLNSNLNLTGGNEAKNRTSYAILTANGYSANIYYNPNCRTISVTGTDEYAADGVCLNIVYDMNGKRNPNEVGKDIGFISVIGNNESVITLAPKFDQSDVSVSSMGPSNAERECRKRGYMVPTWYELEVVAYNKNLTNLPFTVGYVSISPDPLKADYGFGIRGYGARMSNTSGGWAGLVRCIIR